MRRSILYITNRSPLPIVDGQSSRTCNLLFRIAKIDNVTLVCMYENEEQSDEKYLKILRKVCKKVILMKSPEKKVSFSMLSRLVLSAVTIWPYTICRHFSTPFLREIRKELNRKKYDIVHCDNLPVSYTAMLFSGYPTVLTDHDVTYLKIRRMAEQNENIAIKMFLYYEYWKTKRYESRILRKFKRTVVVSDNDKRILQKLVPKCRLVTVENGVDIDEFRAGSGNNSSNTLIWVGGFKHTPNEEAIYHFLEENFAAINSAVRDLKIILIGASPSNRIKRYLTRYPNITHLEYVEKVVDYLEVASVFIAPIRSGSGTKLKIIEAMAAGLAIVTTDVGVEGIEGIDGVHYSVAKSDEDFTIKTIELLGSPEKRALMGASAHALAKNHYDWDTVVQKIYHMHNELCGNQQA